MGMLPMLCKLAKEIPSGKQWVYEHKFDGERCLAVKQGKTVKLFSRNKKLLNAVYPEIVIALKKQKNSFIIDGEIIAFEKKKSSFEKLQQRMFIKNPSPALQLKIKIFYYVFDIIKLDNKIIKGLPLLERKKLLKKNISFCNPLRFSTHYTGNGQAHWKKACRAGWEGIIAKDAASTYVHKRSSSWLKLKCTKGQELVIGGYTNPSGSRTDIGALLVGYYKQENGRITLHYAGKVGTGFNAATLHMLSHKLSAIKRKKSPFAPFKHSARGINWVSPRLIAQIGFEEWTKGGLLRHPRFLGLRTDKKPRDVIREEV